MQLYAHRIYSYSYSGMSAIAHACIYSYNFREDFIYSHAYLHEVSKMLSKHINYTECLICMCEIRLPGHGALCILSLQWSDALCYRE